MHANPITADYHQTVRPTQYVGWTDPRLAKIVRLRLLSDPGYPAWDVSYCHGQLESGEHVNVQLPFSQLTKGNLGVQIIRHAARDGVYAKRLGIFNAISCFI